MTQSILKRLKESIDGGHLVANSAITSTGANSVLPSQISDAYLTNQTRKTNSQTNPTI